MKYLQFITVITAICLTSACAMLPDPIDIADDIELAEFNSVQSAAAAQGKYARWGGSIVAVDNLEDYSVIELVQYPTNHYGKPLDSGESKGRFKAKIKGFVDPLVFEKGRLLTLVGQVTVAEQGIIGEQNYTYPVLAAEGYHMWKLTRDLEVDSIRFSPFSHHWGTHSLFYSRHLFHRGFYPSKVRVKVKDAQSSRSNANQAKASTPSSAAVNSRKVTIKEGAAQQKR